MGVFVLVLLHFIWCIAQVIMQCGQCRNKLSVEAGMYLSVS